MLGRTAALLRGIQDDVSARIVPELQSGDALERAEFARQVILRLSAEFDVIPSASDQHLADLREAVRRARQAVGSSIDDLGPIPDAPGQALVALRSALSAVIPQLSERDVAGDKAARSVLSYIAKVDSAWRQSVEAEIARNEQMRAGGETVTRPVLTPEIVTSYLREHFPDEPDIVATEVKILPGGRSKETVFITLSGNRALPERIVMRQDTQSGVVDTNRGGTVVSDEFPVLQALSRTGLPVARPLWLETERSSLGAPFMFVERLVGKAPGDWTGFKENGRALSEELARVLAALHRTDLSTPGLPVDNFPSPEARMAHELEYRWEKWRRDTVEQSPIIECAFAWLNRECRQGLGGPTIVHGDVAPHNLLADGDRITGLLDWEFTHVGDPAEDLSYCRASVEQQMPWADFMKIYKDAGGQDIDERRLRIFSIYGIIRNCTFSASASRCYLDRVTDDFTIGAIGLVSIPIMEQQLGILLQN